MNIDDHEIREIVACHGQSVLAENRATVQQYILNEYICETFENKIACDRSRFRVKKVDKSVKARCGNKMGNQRMWTIIPTIEYE